MKNYIRAIQYPEKILSEDENNLPALKLLMNIYIEQNNFYSAKDTAEKIYSLEKNQENLSNLIKIFGKLGLLEEVEQYKEQILNSATCVYEYAKQLYDKGNAEDAEKYIDIAITKEPDNEEYIVFKGQTVGCYYPDPMLRTSGDIDFYVTPKDYGRAEQLLMEAYGVELGNDRLDMHDSFKADGVVYELHFRMETFGSGKHQRYYDRLIEEQVARKDCSVEIYDTDVLTLPPTLNVIQVFKHLFHHLLIEGVGMRQVCDLTMLISATHKEIDWDELGKHLKKIGYYKAFLALGALMINHIGLPSERFGFADWERYAKWGDKILSNVFERGNFGRFNRKHTNPGIKKSIETARIAMGHCLTFLPLASSDIIPLIPKRIAISLGKQG